MQLVKNQGLSDLPEAGVVQQISEVGLRNPFELQRQVKAVDQTLGEIAQLDERALRVSVCVVLCVPAHIGEFGVDRTQRLEVQRFRVANTTGPRTENG